MPIYPFASSHKSRREGKRTRDLTIVMCVPQLVSQLACLAIMHKRSATLEHAHCNRIKLWGSLILIEVIYFVLSSLPMHNFAWECIAASHRNLCRIPFALALSHRSRCCCKFVNLAAWPHQHSLPRLLPLSHLASGNNNSSCTTLALLTTLAASTRN
jgi:hypothetical protein